MEHIYDYCVKLNTLLITMSNETHIWLLSTSNGTHYLGMVTSN